jgi:hypothetical protein
VAGALQPSGTGYANFMTNPGSSKSPNGTKNLGFWPKARIFWNASHTAFIHPYRHFQGFGKEASTPDG